MKKQNLQSISIRLRMVADLLCEDSEPIACLVDVGTDHAYLPITLVQEGKAARAVAADVRKGPLEIARQHVQSCQLENCIETRLSDGLDQFDARELSHVVMAGMGGLLICSLCLRAFERGQLARCRMLVLQPQSDLKAVREMLPKIGFKIQREEMCLDRGKYYPAFRCLPLDQGEEAAVDHSDYSQALFQQRSQVFRSYLEHECFQNRQILKRILEKNETGPSEEAGERIWELQKKIETAEQMIQQWN